MDGKRSVLIAAGIIAVAVIVIVIAYVLIQTTGILGNAENGNGDSVIQADASGTDGYTQRVKPTPFGGTVVSSGNKPTPVTGSGSSAGNEPFGVMVNANKTFGTIIMGMEITDGTTTLDMSKVSVEVECNGKTYKDLWSLKPADWTSADADTVLEPGEIVTIVINSKAKGIPVDQPINIKLIESGNEIMKVAATPT